MKSHDFPHQVCFNTADGGVVSSLLWGQGTSAILLAHNKMLGKESWDRQARYFAHNGALVLTIDFRGYGKSLAGLDAEGLHHDVIAGIDYLRRLGAIKVAVMGAGMGAVAAASAAIRVKPHDIDHLYLLAPHAVEKPASLKANQTTFIVGQDDDVFNIVEQAHDKIIGSKAIKIYAGKTYGQRLFTTPEGDQLLALIAESLSIFPFHQNQKTA